jgi:peptidoglycan hydrolase-like protein with peptidoglycan-binding domain
MNENVGEMINDYYVNPNYIFNNNLRIGDRSQDVANLQNRLKEEGFYTGLIGGYFGELTQSALMAYQKSVGLPATGVMDQVVRARLNIETKQALADSIKKLVEENSANGFLAAAAGLLKTNTKNIIIVIFGLIALGLLSWGVMVGLKKLKNTV